MADSGGINAMIAKAVPLLFSNSPHRLRLLNYWLTAASWAEVLTKSGHFDPSIVSIDARKFNSAMSKSNLFGESMTHFDGTNQCAMFQINFQRQFYYYYAQEMRQVPCLGIMHGRGSCKFASDAINKGETCGGSGS
jgi:hypothetical protein